MKKEVMMTVEYSWSHKTITNFQKWPKSIAIYSIASNLIYSIKTFCTKNGQVTSESLLKWLIIQKLIISFDLKLFKSSMPVSNKKLPCSWNIAFRDRWCARVFKWKMRWRWYNLYRVNCLDLTLQIFRYLNQLLKTRYWDAWNIYCI